MTAATENATTRATALAGGFLIVWPSTKFYFIKLPNRTYCSQYLILYRKNGMTNSLKQTQAANVTKNPKAQKSIIVEALYGLLGNGCRRGFDASSRANSNTIWSRSA